MNWGLFLLSVGALLCFWMLFGKITYDRKLRSRSQCTYESLEEEFDSDVSRDAIRIVYNSVVESRGFGIYAGDRLIDDLHYLPHDFEEEFDQVMDSLGVIDFYNSKFAKFLPVETIRDYVHVVSRVIDDHNSRSE